MRTCDLCGEAIQDDSPDPCIGFLDGVEGACCGHGGPDAYVFFGGDDTMGGLEALHWLASLGVGPPPRAEFTAPLAEQHDGQVRLRTVVSYSSGKLLRVEWTNDHPTEIPVWEINGERVELVGNGAVEATDPLVTGSL